MSRPMTNSTMQAICRAAALMAFIPAASPGMPQHRARIAVDVTADAGMLEVLTRNDSIDPAGSIVTTRVVTARIARNATLNRVRVTFDANADDAERPNWDVSVFADPADQPAATERTPLFRLNEAAPDIQIPRPFGISLRAGEPIVIVVGVSGITGDGSPVVHVSLELEAQDGSLRRLPVLSLSAPGGSVISQEQGFSAATANESEWSWRPEVDGRLVAIAGPSLAGAEELVIEDATTHEVLWRTRTASIAPGGSAARQADFIRPGVPVWHGRHYRLRVIYPVAARITPALARVGLVAMILPDGARRP